VAVSELHDKIIIIGTSAAGLLDLRSTPVQNVYAGVEVHANILSGLLDQSVKSRPTYIIALEMLELALLFILSLLLFPRVSIIASALIFLFFSGVITTFNFYLWSLKNIDTHLATPLILFSLLYGGQMFFGFFFENRKKKQLSNIFGQYIPKELVDEMSNSDEEFTLKGESREMTVFFSDVRGFTTISESLEAAELCDLINAILTPVTRIIHENKGTIDKYIGDAIMAFWGAPIEDADHPNHAVGAALAMQAKLEELKETYRQRNWPNIAVGLGLSTGDMTVGDMGSNVRRAYTVMGDAVNLGSRLEGITRQYGVGIIVSEVTKSETTGISYRDIDRVRVKGKDVPITIYQPMGYENSLSSSEKEQIAQWNEFIQLYRDQDWDRAQASLNHLIKGEPNCFLYEVYAERITAMRANSPGPDWDGVTKYDSK